jgi:hypothetical protein
MEFDTKPLGVPAPPQAPLPPKGRIHCDICGNIGEWSPYEPNKPAKHTSLICRFLGWLDEKTIR